MNGIFGDKVMGGKSFKDLQEESEMEELRETQQRTIKDRLFGNNNIMDNIRSVNFSEKVMGGEKFSNFMSGKMNSLDSPSQYSERVSLLTQQTSNNPFSNDDNNIKQYFPKNNGGFKMKFNNNMKLGTNKVNEYFGGNKVKNKLFSDGTTNKMFGNAKNVVQLFQNPFNGGNNAQLASKKVNEYLGSNQVKNKLFSDGANAKLFSSGANVKLFNSNINNKIFNTGMNNKMVGPTDMTKFFGTGRRHDIMSDLKSKNKEIDELTGVNDNATGEGVPIISAGPTMESFTQSMRQTQIGDYVGGKQLGSWETTDKESSDKFDEYFKPKTSIDTNNNDSLGQLLSERSSLLSDINNYRSAFNNEKSANKREQYRKIMSDLNRRVSDIDKNINDVKKFERETANKAVEEQQKTARERLKYDFETQKLGQKIGLSQSEFDLRAKESAFGRARKLEQSMLGEELARSEQELAKQRLGLQTQTQSDKFALERARLKNEEQKGDIAYMQSKLQAGQQLIGGLLGGQGQTNLGRVLDSNPGANMDAINQLVATRNPYEPQASFEQKVYDSVGSASPNIQQPVQIRPQMQPQVQLQPQDPQYQPQQPLPREQLVRPSIDWDRINPQQAAQIDPEYAKYLAESEGVRTYRRGPYRKR